MTLALTCPGLSPLALRADRESAFLPRHFERASTLHEALESARERGEAVIVYCTRTRAPPCNILQSRLRREDVAAPFREGYILSAVWGSSMDRSERRSYHDRYNVVGATTWLFSTSDGEYVRTSIGGFTFDRGGKRLRQAVQLLLGAAPHAEQTVSRIVSFPDRQIEQAAEGDRVGKTKPFSF